MKTTINAALTGLALVSSFASQAETPETFKVASLVPAQYSLTQQTESLNEQGSQVVISEFNASFIKVHFSRFQLPTGMAVVVSNETGTEQYHYGPGLNTPRTYDIASGDNGVTNFSSMSIDGNKAIVKLVGEAVAGDNTQPIVEINSYQRGQTAIEMEQLALESINLGHEISPESICQLDNKRAVACYENSEPEAYARSKPVVRLLMGGGVCTAWRVGNGNHFFTNNHCIANQSEANAAEVQFNYQESSCGGGDAVSFKLQVDRLLATDEDLDYSVFTVRNFEQAESFGYLGLDPRRPELNEKIYIPQHPGGRKKELGIESDNGYCKIDFPTYRGLDSGYQCDTEGGSSGSPVLSQNSNKVIALHHLGGCGTNSGNSGARMELIWPQVASLFNNQVPDGSFDDTAGKPTARMTYSCDKLSCSFNGTTSSDSDGQLVSYTWSFGDGTTATGATVNHSYVTNGSYSVSLTVKDNSGLSAIMSNTVQVSNIDTGLSNGVAVEVSGNKGSKQAFTFNVPENATSVNVKLSGGSGDADLYVKHGSEATVTSYDCRSWQSSNNENCDLSPAKAGVYHTLLHAYEGFSAASLVASYKTGTVDNVVPVADFNTSINGLTVNFSDASRDSDGQVMSWSWNFGDGATSDQASPNHSYSAAGTYQVQLTVADDKNASHTVTKAVTVTTDTGNGCNGVQAYDASAIYLADAQVEYQNNIYKANWWTQNENPAENSGEWEVWSFVQACP